MDLGRVRCLLVSFLAVASAATVLGAQSPPEQPNSYAVIVGVSEFSQLPKEEWLQYAHADAGDFFKFITSPRGRSFPPENVFLLTNEAASFQAIRSRLGSTLAKKIKPGDTVYIFIATHGMVEREASREAYLLAHDSDREDLYTSALPMRELGSIIQSRLKNAQRIFLFADTCRAGKLGQVQGAVNRYIEDVTKQRGETMGLLASRPNEFSREGNQFGGGHGVFTYYLLKGLMGEADSDKDSIVTAAEIVSYLQTQVETSTDRQQHVRDFGDFEPTTPLSFVDKPGPADWKLASPARRQRTEIASLQAVFPESAEVRDAFQRALQEGRLLNPPGNSAWELYRRYSQLPVPEPEKAAAQDDLLIALATAGDRVLWAYRRGDQVVRLDAAKYEEGAQLFSRAGEIDPDDPSLSAKSKFMAGRALVENRRFSDGIRLLRESIALDPEAAYAYNALGIAAMEQQLWNEAIAQFRAASERAEKWVYPHYNLARVYAAQRRYREAEEEFRKGIALGTELGLKYSYLHYNLGILHVYQGRHNEAEQEFRRAVQMNPEDAMSYHNLGLLFEQRGDGQQAETSFRRAAELDPRLVEPRLKLAEIYRRQRRPDLQEAILREAVTGNPRHATAWESLGRLLLEDKKLSEAEQVFLQMLGNDVNPPVALAGLGDVHVAQERFGEAAEDYRQAMARTTDQRFRRDLERKLRSVERKR